MTPEELLNTHLIPLFSTKLPQNSKQSLLLFLNQCHQSMSAKQLTYFLPQFLLLPKKFPTSSKLKFLSHPHNRQFLIFLIKHQSLIIFNLSYLNRSNIDHDYLIYLHQLKPHLFIQILMIVSKLKTIHKHFYQQLSQKILESHVHVKILKILQLCNQTKRTVNNNKAKFMCIVQEANDRIEIAIELGKMLRAAWKIDKEKRNILINTNSGNKKKIKEDIQYQQINSQFCFQQNYHLYNPTPILRLQSVKIPEISINLYTINKLNKSQEQLSQGESSHLLIHFQDNNKDIQNFHMLDQLY